MENSTINNTPNQENTVNSPDNAKLNEFIKDILKEKNSIEASACPNASRLLDEEINKAQAKGKPVKETKFVDIYREKAVRVAVKVLVPVKEHPRFNFVGKLLGPRGNSLRRLQDDTLTKMAILGKGSMRDKQKEEELRNSLDPKYSHLSDELHVEVSALAPPAEAHARIAYALAELRKYLVPDSNDEIRLEQLREIQSEPVRRGVGRGRAPPHPRGAVRADAENALHQPRKFPLLPLPENPPQPTPVFIPRPPLELQMSIHPGLAAPPPPRPAASSKGKVLSILDRARQAMEEPSYPEYEDSGYGYEQPPPAGYAGEYDSGADYYDTPSYSAPGASGRWKGYKSAVGRGYNAGSGRPTPYSSRPIPK